MYIIKQRNALRTQDVARTGKAGKKFGDREIFWQAKAWNTEAEFLVNSI
jgi:hypothetical protein